MSEVVTLGRRKRKSKKKDVSKLKLAARKLFSKLNSANPKIRTKAKKVYDKLAKLAKNGKPQAKSLLKYIKSLASEEQGDRIMGLCK